MSTSFGPYQLSGRGQSGQFDLLIVPDFGRVLSAFEDAQQALARQPLTRYLDYQIDYDHGLLLFKQPVPATDPSGNPVFIMVTYGAETGGATDDAGNGASGEAGTTGGAASPGSAVHDEIGYRKAAGFAGFTRVRNNAGGIEGGVSNGEDIRVRGYLKPISTLRRPLQSVDFASREPVKAAYERSDVCVVPAAGVAGESMVALTLARCALEKFGGDSMGETLRNFEGYRLQLKNY